MAAITYPWVRIYYGSMGMFMAAITVPTGLPMAAITYPWVRIYYGSMGMFMAAITVPTGLPMAAITYPWVSYGDHNWSSRICYGWDRLLRDRTQSVSTFHQLCILFLPPNLVTITYFRDNSVLSGYLAKLLYSWWQTSIWNVPIWIIYIEY